MKSQQASSTAALIALSTAYLARDPQLRWLVVEEAATISAHFVRQAGTAGAHLLPLIGQKWFRLIIDAIEGMTIPGIQVHYALRKRYLEEAVRGAINAGMRQVVVLGAGFDTMTLRMHREFRGVFFLEIDHPATQNARLSALAEWLQPNDNLEFLSLDFSQGDLISALDSCRNYDAIRPAFFIAEGLTMYLEIGAINRLFRGVSCVTSPGSRYAFTFFEPTIDGSINFDRSSLPVDLWLKLRGEKFLWGIERRELASFLQTHGFGVGQIATDDTLRSLYLSGRSLGERSIYTGEQICLAEKG